MEASRDTAKMKENDDVAGFGVGFGATQSP
jgi:hypothetical protein